MIKKILLFSAVIVGLAVYYIIFCQIDGGKHYTDPLHITISDNSTNPGDTGFVSKTIMFNNSMETPTYGFMYKIKVFPKAKKIAYYLDVYPPLVQIHKLLNQFKSFKEAADFLNNLDVQANGYLKSKIIDEDGNITRTFVY